MNCYDLNTLYKFCFKIQYESQHVVKQGII
jgi:hypothetical protein